MNIRFIQHSNNLVAKFCGSTKYAILVSWAWSCTCLSISESRAQNLTLFPNSTVAVQDNVFPDTNLGIGVIEILPANAVPVPDASGLPTDIEFVGEIHTSIVGPNNSQGGSVSVTITNIFGTVFGGWFTNNSGVREQVGSTPFDRFDYAGMLEFVFVDYPTLFGAGTVSAEINAELGQLVGNDLVNPANNNTLDQQLRLGVSATTFVGNNFQDFAYAHAWPDPGPTYTTVQPMNDGPNLHSGVYSGGPGTLQIHIDDALVLGGGDTIHMPHSIEIVLTGSPVPEPASLLLAAFGLLALIARRKRPRHSD